MDYGELIQVYFERSVALQWYWTIYILVIGGVLAFSTFRVRPELATTILVMLLYVGFAWKNLGAIEATAVERGAVLSLINDYEPGGAPNADYIVAVQARLKPAMPRYDIAGARNFHIACDVLTVLLLWVKEFLRRRAAEQTPVAVR